MKRRIVIALTAALAATALAQSPSPSQLLAEQKARLVASRDGAPNGTWKQLTDDVMLLVFQSDRGEYRGRLYVRIGGTWQPVSADGLGDLKGFLPVK